MVDWRIELIKVEDVSYMADSQVCVIYIETSCSRFTKNI